MQADTYTRAYRTYAHTHTRSPIGRTHTSAHIRRGDSLEKVEPHKSKASHSTHRHTSTHTRARARTHKHLVDTNPQFSCRLTSSLVIKSIIFRKNFVGRSTGAEINLIQSGKYAHLFIECTVCVFGGEPNERICGWWCGGARIAYSGGKNPSKPNQLRPTANRTNDTHTHTQIGGPSKPRFWTRLMCVRLGPAA